MLPPRRASWAFISVAEGIWAWRGRLTSRPATARVSGLAMERSMSSSFLVRESGCCLRPGSPGGLSRRGLESHINDRTSVVTGVAACQPVVGTWLARSVAGSGPVLLLGAGVDIASTEQELPDRHHHHLMLGEQPAQDGLGFGIEWILEARCDDAAIDDQEVHVAACQADRRIARLAARQRHYAGTLLGAGVQRAGNRHAAHAERPATRVASLRQHAQRRLATFEVRVGRILRPGQPHLAGAREA